MKRILALAIAVMMLCVCAISVSAAQTTLPDTEGLGWWQGHTEGIEITEEGVVITFTNTTIPFINAANGNDETANWHGPLYVLYTGDEAKVNGAGYVEYWVTRADAYGWGNPAYYGVTGDLNPDANNATAVANMATAGITFSSTGVDGWVGWDNWIAAQKAGAEGKITAKLVGNKANVEIVINGLQTTVELPVDTSKPTYLSLFGDSAKLTNITVTTNEPAPKTGDETMLLPAAIALVLSASALVVLKKKH